MCRYDSEICRLLIDYISSIKTTFYFYSFLLLYHFIRSRLFYHNCPHRRRWCEPVRQLILRCWMVYKYLFKSSTDLVCFMWSVWFYFYRLVYVYWITHQTFKSSKTHTWDLLLHNVIHCCGRGAGLINKCKGSPHPTR